MKQRLFTIMIAAVIFLTLVAPVHTVADIALPVDEPVDRYETVTDIGEDPQLTSIADGCSILKYVDEKDFLSNDFKRRVEMEESLSSYVFEREDGTRRLYLLGEDVKFEAADGTVIEKNITLNKTGEGYSTARNNIGLSISESLSDGVQIFFGDNKLSILPMDTGVRYSAVLRDNTIVYSGVYGEGTELDFTPTLSGVKQDVVLNSYTGNNAFEYIVFSETLSPFSVGNCVFFAENENSDYRFDFGPIYIYDAAGHFTSGDMEIAEIDEGRWLITIIAPTEFLESDNTIYPVTIDPTIQVKASESTAYIEDTTIYSGKPNLNTGSWLYNHTGLISDGYDVGRMLVRIPGLYDSNTTYAYLHVEQIDNVSFCIYEASGSTGQRVDLYYYNGTAWTESTATWNNTSPNGYGYLFDTKYPGNDLKTTFDITDLVKGWKNGTYTASKGFMLKNYNESDGNKYKAFDASESTTSSRKPYVVLDYTPVISINESVININEGESYTPTVSTLSSEPVYWMSSNSSVASVDSTGKITAIKASSSSVSITAYTLFHNNLYPTSCTVYVKIPDGTYYIKNKSTERYADATGYSVGDEVLRWQFHGASNQRWDIEYISNGLYSIKNKMSNLYLGVETLNSTSSITRQYSALGDSTKWYISKTSSGAYCFYAKGNLTYSYVIGADPLNNNTIVNMTYSNDSDYKDEWILTRFNSISVRKLTDETYREEYVSYQSVINNYLSVISFPFERSWALLFEHGAWYSDSSLPAADCPLANNQRCHDHQGTCGTACSNDASTPNHHKNHYRNWYLVRELGKGETDITIGFFGFNPCSNGGLSLDWLSTVCQPTNTTFSEQYNRRTLQHEISHLFGCHDGECTDGQNCIMSGGFDNCANFDQIDIWCSNCHESFDRLAH